MNNQTFFFIINPHSGGQKAKRNWPKLQTALQKQNIDFDYSFTEGKNHATTIVQQALIKGFRRFVVAGGDGTVNEVVNGIFKQQDIATHECVITVLPWGTGNDWAAYYQIPKNIDSFINMLKQAKTTTQDIGQVSYQKDNQEQLHYFMNFVGTGFDSYLLEKMENAGGQRLKYFYYVLKCLHSFTGKTLQVQSTENNFEKSAMMMMCCLGKFGGAGMKFAPDADASDGLFNNVLLADMPFLKRLFSLAYLFNGKINQHKSVTAWQSASLSISNKSPMKFQCDGELVGELPITINQRENAIQVLIPRK